VNPFRFSPPAIPREWLPDVRFVLVRLAEPGEPRDVVLARGGTRELLERTKRRIAVEGRRYEVRVA
jgi:hypothetical protein